MSELQSIVDAYTAARARGERMALATVVSVEGSAYRRPGARMLMSETGVTCGSISGGCLERDVAERAAQVMKAKTACVVEYDTRGNEDIVWGLGLGCNGVVRVLLESLHEGSGGARALQFIAESLRARKSGVIATVISNRANSSDGGERAMKVCDRVLLDSELNLCGANVADERLMASIRENALEVLARGQALRRAYETRGGSIEIFFDLITPPRPLVIFGAEQDALPLVQLARTLDWHVTVVDTRARSASVERFVAAHQVMLCRAVDVAAQLSLTENTAAVLMTHNYLDDVELLRALLPSPVCYLGILGPKQRTFKLLEEIGSHDSGLAAAKCARLHSPVGIDIGAETPAEIALSIMAEIKAVCAARGGGFLRERNAPIHDEPEAEPASPTSIAIANGTRLPVSESEPLRSCYSS